MEKIVFKPVAKEIILKGSVKDGPIDLFSYDYETDHNKRQLGNLYVVGNIQVGSDEPNSNEIDVAYVINLIASLAKREYYAKPDLPIKDAFSGALKKINGVVEEFFKKQDTRINIGIFAVAGGEIHISKLGKFKIFLARDGKNIDILNNIQLFNKETTQEKQFSNIISGKVNEGDRILAFYPSRAVTAREKYFKDYLLNSTQDDFAAKLAAIKEQKADFACAALHIEIQKTTEDASAPRIQPRELREEIQPEEIAKPAVRLAKEEKISEDSAESISEDKLAPETELQPVRRHAIKPVILSDIEIPRIIPSEFASWKKEFPLAKHLRRLKKMNINPRNKMFVMGGAAGLVIIVVVMLKVFVFVSPASRALDAAVSSAQNTLKLAQTKVNEDDLVGAHSMLVSALASITDSENKNGQSGKAEAVKNDISKALDGLDNATDATLAKVADIAPESGNATLVLSSGTDFYTYLDQSGKASLAKVSGGSISKQYDVSNLAPTAMFGSDAYIALIDPSAKKIASFSLKKSTIANSSFSATDPLVNMDIYQDNLYGLTGTGIIKVADAASGHGDSSSWLHNGTALASDPALIAVDGKVYVLSATGVLTTYYKGQKTNEASTPVAPDSSTMLLTNTDSPNLYVINKTLGRVYIITKDSGSLTKTLKLNSTQAITSATLDAADNVFILSDNKIWSVK